MPIGSGEEFGRVCLFICVFLYYHNNSLERKSRNAVPPLVLSMLQKLVMFRQLYKPENLSKNIF